jgi:hypothetical protein
LKKPAVNVTDPVVTIIVPSLKKGTETVVSPLRPLRTKVLSLMKYPDVEPLFSVIELLVSQVNIAPMLLTMSATLLPLPIATPPTVVEP